jgi:ABC-2 type transport system permease protein
LNCVDYLCDDNNLIEVRSKEVILRLLDKGTIKKDKLFWQSLNMILPIFMIVIFGLLNAFYRKKRWA